HQANGFRRTFGAFDLNVAPDERIGDAGVQVFQAAVFQNNTVFYFAVANGAVIVNGGIGTDERVFDEGAFADDGGSANFGIDDARALFYNDAPFQNRILDSALIFFVDHFQDQAVRFEHVADASRVHPLIG